MLKISKGGNISKKLPGWMHPRKPQSGELQKSPWSGNSRTYRGQITLRKPNADAFLWGHPVMHSSGVARKSTSPGSHRESLLWGCAAKESSSPRRQALQQFQALYNKPSIKVSPKAIMVESSRTAPGCTSPPLEMVHDSQKSKCGCSLRGLCGDALLQSGELKHSSRAPW